MIGVTYQTVRKIRDRGELRCTKVGGIYRVYEDELVRFLTYGNYVNEANIDNILREKIK